MALVEQLGVGRWYVKLAAAWQWYVTLCIYITVLGFVFKLLFLSIPLKQFWYR